MHASVFKRVCDTTLSLCWIYYRFRTLHRNIA